MLITLLWTEVKFLRTSIYSGMPLKERKCEEGAAKRYSHHYHELQDSTSPISNNELSHARSEMRTGMRLVVVAMCGTISTCTSVLVGPSLFPNCESKSLAVKIVENMLRADLSVCQPHQDCSNTTISNIIIDAALKRHG